MIRISTLSVGQNRGQPRIWIEGRFLERAGFEVGTSVDVVLSPSRVVIEVYLDGQRVVSGSRVRPVPSRRPDHQPVLNRVSNSNTHTGDLTCL